MPVLNYSAMATAIWQPCIEYYIIVGLHPQHILTFGNFLRNVALDWRKNLILRKLLNVSFWRYREFLAWKISRNSVKFRGISRNYTTRNLAEFRRNFNQFRTEYGIHGSKKNRRNSVSTEFRGHPICSTAWSARDCSAASFWHDSSSWIQ